MLARLPLLLEVSTGDAARDGECTLVMLEVGSLSFSLLLEGEEEGSETCGEIADSIPCAAAAAAAAYTRTYSRHWYNYYYRPFITRIHHK